MEKYPKINQVREKGLMELTYWLCCIAPAFAGKFEWTLQYPDPALVIQIVIPLLCTGHPPTQPMPAKHHLPTSYE